MESSDQRAGGSSGRQQRDPALLRAPRPAGWTTAHAGRLSRLPTLYRGPARPPSVWSW